MTPGEESIVTAINSGRGFTYLDNTTMSGAYAQALGAAVVVLERKYLGVGSIDTLLKMVLADRYFGGSSPYDGFDSETLQYLTMEQAAADVVNFAQTVAFPFDKNKTSVASKTASTTHPQPPGLNSNKNTAVGILGRILLGNTR